MGSLVQARARATCPRPLSERNPRSAQVCLSVCLTGTVQTPALAGTQDTLLSQGSQLCSLRPGSSPGWGLLAPPGTALGGRIQPALPPPRPQPYRTLKESDSAGDEAESPEQRAREPVGPTPAPHDRAASINLLEDVFSNLDMEVPLQPLGQAKSLEDLRTPKDLREQPGTFDYQVWWLEVGTGWGHFLHVRQVFPHDSETPREKEPLFQVPQPVLRVTLTANSARRASGQSLAHSDRWRTATA